MTTLTHYESIDEIRRRLAAVEIKRRTLGLVTGLVAMAALVAGGLLAAAVACGYWTNQPPLLLRWAVLSVLCVGWAAGLVWFVLRPSILRHNTAQVARYVEQAMPQLGNDLINSVLLSTDADQASGELVQQAINEAAAETRSVDFGQSISRRALRQWCFAAGLCAVMVSAFASFQTGPFRRGLMAVMNPGAYVPGLGTVELVELAPGDTTIFAGDSVTITAQVRNARAAKLRGEVIFEGQSQPMAMLATEAFTTFSLPMGRIEQTVRYAVRIGDTRWPQDKPYYTVNVLQRVEVAKVSLAYKYPAYTGLESVTVDRNVADASIEAPQGSSVTVTVELSADVPAVMFERHSGLAEQMTPAALGVFSATFNLDADNGWRLVLRDADGRSIQQYPEPDQSSSPVTGGGNGGSLMKGYYRIHAVADPPPRIEFIAPNRDVSAAPGEKVKLRIKAYDKYGLDNVKVMAGLDKQPMSQATARSMEGKAEGIIEYEYTVDASLPDDKGLVVVYYATASDRRNLSHLGPQTTATPKFKILVQDAAKVAAARAKRYEELRRRLMALLRLQSAQRVNTGLCLQRHRRLMTLRDEADNRQTVEGLRKEVSVTSASITAAQYAIRAEIIDLLEKFPFEREMAGIQQALALLAANEAQLAIEQSAVFGESLGAGAEVQADVAARRDMAGMMLGNTQEKIISALQMLLAIMPSLTGETQSRDTAGGSDLPPEARQKLTKLKTTLEEFIEAEKKAIEASGRLVKKPVDTFTSEDEKVLKDLLATQDKWEKFLNEALADFSRLAQQDFSNPALLKELLSVKNDVTMAKDALSKKATEIATAMENNGVENAESLTANIEKWLPDKPDRTKWAMEAPEGQDNIEMPELPGELEDLVGDLLEQEEDLFDEMDDVTSKASMSGDKGIGWDAMDGPISSMNAQGVTGNQLPNSSEIHGRSGEGRTGKSTGEFVEDKAVGKGGRRTPTRLTPEPFQKGQIDDTSSEPPGGATGGGKLSGSGQEGLEGPVPPALAREMKRLAGKQASLMNRAERIQAKFSVSDYSNFKLTEAIKLMDRVRGDLERNRYRNALRLRKETLAAMKQSHLLLSGNVDVTVDASASMPMYIRDDIADAMKGKLPAEYRDALKQYYQRIAR